MNTGPMTLSGLAGLLYAFEHMRRLGFEFEGEMHVQWYGRDAAVLSPSPTTGAMRVDIGIDL
jgi:hypothetical protein